MHPDGREAVVCGRVADGFPGIGGGKGRCGTDGFGRPFAPEGASESYGAGKIPGFEQQVVFARKLHEGRVVGLLAPDEQPEGPVFLHMPELPPGVGQDEVGRAGSRGLAQHRPVAPGVFLLGQAAAAGGRR